MKITKALVALIAIMPATPAAAAATDWIDVAPGARLRALSAGTEDGGKALIGLEVALGPGLKTYWRVPGETGMPTDLAVLGAGGPAESQLLWPLPERDTSQGFVDFVYHGDLVLPVLVDAPASEPLDLSVRMGICSDICVPVTARLKLPGDAKPDAANDLRLRQALADTPIPYTENDPPLTDIALDPENGTLTLGYDPDRIDPTEVFPSFDGTQMVFSAPEIDLRTDRIRFMPLVRKGDTSWRDKPLRLTFATGDGPYDIVVAQPAR